MGDPSDLLLGLVKQYSPSGEEQAAAAWLQAQMLALGFSHAYQDAVGNVVGVMGEGPRQLVLMGHIDTVSGEILVRLEGDLLYGRGTVDAKGPLACFTEAVALTGAREGWQLVVIGAVDEERDSVGARFVVDHFNPNYLIIGEPSGWDRVTLGYKGVAVIELAARRPRTHSAGQEKSAADTVMDVWFSIRNFVAAFNQEVPRVFDQISPTILEMGAEIDNYETRANLLVSTRLPLSFSPEAWYEMVAANAAAELVSVIYSKHPIPAYRADKNSPLVRSFLRAIRTEGGKPSFLVKTGTADLNIVAPEWGCPSAVYGPGDSVLDHTPDEHISLAEYQQSVRILHEVLVDLTA